MSELNFMQEQSDRVVPNADFQNIVQSPLFGAGFGYESRLIPQLKSVKKRLKRKCHVSDVGLKRKVRKLDFDGALEFEWQNIPLASRNVRKKAYFVQENSCNDEEYFKFQSDILQKNASEKYNLQKLDNKTNLQWKSKVKSVQEFESKENVDSNIQDLQGRHKKRLKRSHKNQKRKLRKLQRKQRQFENTSLEINLIDEWDQQESMMKDDQHEHSFIIKLSRIESEELVLDISQFWEQVEAANNNLELILSGEEPELVVTSDDEQMQSESDVENECEESKMDLSQLWRDVAVLCEDVVQDTKEDVQENKLDIVDFFCENNLKTRSENDHLQDNESAIAATIVSEMKMCNQLNISQELGEDFQITEKYTRVVDEGTRGVMKKVNLETGTDELKVLASNLEDVADIREQDSLILNGCENISKLMEVDPKMETGQLDILESNLEDVVDLCEQDLPILNGWENNSKRMKVDPEMGTDELKVLGSNLEGVADICDQDSLILNGCENISKPMKFDPKMGTDQLKILESNLEDVDLCKQDLPILNGCENNSKRMKVDPETGTDELKVLANNLEDVADIREQDSLILNGCENISKRMKFGPKMGTDQLKILESNLEDVVDLCEQDSTSLNGCEDNSKRMKVDPETGTDELKVLASNLEGVADLREQDSLIFNGCENISKRMEFDPKMETDELDILESNLEDVVDLCEQDSPILNGWENSSQRMRLELCTNEEKSHCDSKSVISLVQMAIIDKKLEFDDSTENASSSVEVQKCEVLINNSEFIGACEGVPKILQTETGNVLENKSEVSSSPESIQENSCKLHIQIVDIEDTNPLELKDDHKIVIGNIQSHFTLNVCDKIDQEMDVICKNVPSSKLITVSSKILGANVLDSSKFCGTVLEDCTETQEAKNENVQNHQEIHEFDSELPIVTTANHINSLKVNEPGNEEKVRDNQQSKLENELLNNKTDIQKTTSENADLKISTFIELDSDVHDAYKIWGEILKQSVQEVEKAKEDVEEIKLSSSKNEPKTVLEKVDFNKISPEEPVTAVGSILDDSLIEVIDVSTFCQQILGKKCTETVEPVNEPLLKPQARETLLNNKTDIPKTLEGINLEKNIKDKVQENLPEMQPIPIKKNFSIVEDILKTVGVNFNEKNVPYKLIDVSRDNELRGKFRHTFPEATIRRIQRVENPFLLAQYALSDHRKKIKKRDLFHGTKPCYVDSICKKNFDWRMMGQNGMLGCKYGCGVSFSPEARYASEFPRNFRTVPRIMFMCRVLVGRMAIGDSRMKVAPKGFNSSRSMEGEVIVKFDDNEFYPEYIFHYSK